MVAAAVAAVAAVGEEVGAGVVAARRQHLRTRLRQPSPELRNRPLNKLAAEAAVVVDLAAEDVVRAFHRVNTL